MDTGFGYVLDPRLVLAVSELRVRRHRESPPRSGGGRASEEWIGDLKVAALVAVTLTLVAGSAFKDSGAVSHQRLSRDKAAPEHHRCPDARSAVPYYRFYTHLWQTARGVRLASGMMIRGHTCGYARFAAKEWRGRARAARHRYELWTERLSRPTTAILYVFGEYGQQALAVASCESGRGVYARNGQYLGMFQMGEYARAAYGHSWTALGQARSAYAYFVASGRDWSPWSCKPW